jgi:hypothetical protein
MATVRQQLDALAADGSKLDAVVADFAGRSWPARKRSTDAQAWGVEDDDVPGDNDWALVEQDSRLTGAQYRVLAEAYRRSRG